VADLQKEICKDLAVHVNARGTRLPLVDLAECVVGRKGSRVIDIVCECEIMCLNSHCLEPRKESYQIGFDLYVRSNSKQWGSVTRSLNTRLALWLDYREKRTREQPTCHGNFSAPCIVCYIQINVCMHVHLHMYLYLLFVKSIKKQTRRWICESLLWYDDDCFSFKNGTISKATQARPQMPAMQVALDMVKVKMKKWGGGGGAKASFHVWELTHRLSIFRQLTHVWIQCFFH